jgi:hypothetical protein
VRGKTITAFIAYETLTRLTGLADGEALEWLTGARAEIDSGIRAWCRSRGQELAAARHTDRRQRYLDRRLPRDRVLRVHLGRPRWPTSA